MKHDGKHFPAQWPALLPLLSRAGAAVFKNNNRTQDDILSPLEPEPRLPSLAGDAAAAEAYLRQKNAAAGNWLQLHPG